VSTPPNPTGDEPVQAASTAEVLTSTVEAILAVTSPVETVVADQPAVAQEADFTPDTNHACVQLVEQTGEPTYIGANCGHKKPAGPARANTDSAKACGSSRSPGACPVSPKGGQRRPPRTGTHRKHSPWSRRPRCCHAWMCPSPRSCILAHDGVRAAVGSEGLGFLVLCLRQVLDLLRLRGCPIETASEGRTRYLPG
jgi:hypothetical protein